MEYYEKRFPNSEIHLYPLGDWHYGSPRCDEKLMRKVVKIVMNDPIGYWLGIGDFHENNLEGSTGSSYEQLLNPEEQLYGRFENNGKLRREGLFHILEPIKDKCLFMIEGNHGYRTTKASGLVPDKMIATHLGAPFKGISCLGKIYVKDTTFKILAHHGHGGGRTLGGKINVALRIRDLAPTADLTISGHTHTISRTPSVWFDLIQGATGNKHSPLYEGMGWDYVCGSLLSYNGSYAERKVMPPAVKGQIMIKLFHRINGHIAKLQRYEVLDG